MLLALPLRAQTELGTSSAPSNAWGLVSVHRVWLPQDNNRHNDGFGFCFFSSIDDDRRWWAGLNFITTGIRRRDAMALEGGLGVWLAGTARLGAFSYLTTGMGASSNSGLAGFDFFTDPSMTFGWASQAGVGACAEITSNIRVQATVVGMWFTNEGVTPYGLQLGIITGGP